MYNYLDNIFVIYIMYFQCIYPLHNLYTVSVDIVLINMNKNMYS